MGCDEILDFSKCCTIRWCATCLQCARRRGCHMFTHHPGSSAHVCVGHWREDLKTMMLKRDYLALAACVTQLLSSLPSSGKTWELPWAWREAVWWWWYGSMKTTRSCMTKLKRRSRPCPRPSSVDMWTVSLSRQIACICDLGMHASIFVRNLGCLQLFLNFIFFSCNSVVVVSLDLIHQL